MANGGTSDMLQWPSNVFVKVTSHVDGNLALHTGDNPIEVNANRKRLGSGLPDTAVWLRQVHGTEVVQIATGWTGEATADASYSQLQDTPLAILVADCLPAVIASVDGREIAAVHAGWRGLADGILHRVVSAFESSSLVAYLGPCIGPCHYEVDAKVRDRMTDQERGTGFAVSRDDHWNMDLQQIARDQLEGRGVAIERADDRCTACSALSGGKEQLYSHRLASKKGTVEIRRFAVLVWRQAPGKPGASSCPG